MKPTINPALTHTAFSLKDNRSLSTGDLNGPVNGMAIIASGSMNRTAVLSMLGIAASALQGDHINVQLDLGVFSYATPNSSSGGKVLGGFRVTTATNAETFFKAEASDTSDIGSEGEKATVTRWWKIPKDDSAAEEWKVDILLQGKKSDVTGYTYFTARTLATDAKMETADAGLTEAQVKSIAQQVLDDSGCCSDTEETGGLPNCAPGALEVKVPACGDEEASVVTYIPEGTTTTTTTVLREGTIGDGFTLTSDVEKGGSYRLGQGLLVVAVGVVLYTGYRIVRSMMSDAQPA